MAGSGVKINLRPKGELMAELGLDKGGRVQQYIDRAVMDFCEPYVPFDTGALKESPRTCSPPGEGRVVYGVPYARRQYFENKGDGGLRGARWFDRMKADRLGEIVEGAAFVAGSPRDTGRR